MPKKVIKKVAAKKAAPDTLGKLVERRDPQTQTDRVANWEATTHKKVPTEKAKKVHKVVSLHVSVGDKDRGRLMEEFKEFLIKKIGAVPYGKEGIHATVMGEYYIVDGLVCQTGDYDSIRETFKVGTAPPTWAGGPPPAHANRVYEVSGGKFKSTSVSAKDWDKKYPDGVNPNVKKPDPDALIEELDWDAEDALDESIAEAEVDKSLKRLNGKKVATKKVVRKKVAAPEVKKKTVVRRKK